MATCKKNIIPAQPVPPTVTFVIELNEQEAANLRTLLGKLPWKFNDSTGLTSLYSQLGREGANYSADTATAFQNCLAFR